MALSTKNKQPNRNHLSLIELDGHTNDAHALDDVKTVSNGSNTKNAKNCKTVDQKERSVVEVNNLGMGSKKASLYLSRTASLINPGQQNKSVQQSETKKQNVGSRQGSTVSAAGSNSVPPSAKPSSVMLQKEFTFTGYDIMSDNEPEERPATSTDGDVEEKRENVQFYMSACKQLGIHPVMYAARHINDKHITMKSHPLGTDGARALCIALVNNTFVQSLDLEDNDIGPEGGVCVAEMLQKNKKITTLRLAENAIGTRGVFALSELLKGGKDIHTLDLSGSNLDDSDAKYISEMIEFNQNMKVLNVRHNRLGDGGGFDLGRAIALNETLHELDISWNHIRGKGALAIAIGVQKNVGLKKLNIAWNGLAKEGSMGLGRALEENRTLRELDISNNRIGVEQVGAILKGLQQNDGLYILRMGQNPYSPDVAMTILKAIEASDKCVLTQLDLSDIVVRTEFLEAWDQIKAKREKPLRILFGTVVRGEQPPTKDPNDLDWRDPVIRMFKYMQDQGYRVIDLLKRLDKDRNFSLDRNEFKMGMQAENIPLTEAQLDEVVDRLDKDGDGEVDLGELISGEKEFRRKMHARMRRMNRQGPRVDVAMKKLIQISEL